MKKELLLIIQSLIPLEINAALPVYPAEIIGRDLDAPKMGKIGHVGITTAPNIWQDAYQVIEVLNETPVIQTNTFSNFKSRSPYWGSRYGISDRGDNALRILREANFQKDLGCATYTLTASYSVSTGGYDSRGHAKPTYCGYYRCDTFVNYVFYWGHYTLPTYSPPGSIEKTTFPYLVYNAFPLGNGDGPKSITLPRMVNQEIKKNEENISINNITAKQLSALTPEEFFSVVDISDNKITIEGAKNILNLAQDQTLSLEDRVFLMDKLGFVGTIEMIPSLIRLYNNLDDSNTNLKNQILATTQNIHQRKFTKREFEEKNLLQTFYFNLLTQKLSPTQKEIVIRGFLALSSENVIASHLDLINSILDNKEENIPPRIILGLKIELFNMLYESGNVDIKNIINFLKKENNAELEGVFNLFLVNRLSHLGAHSLDQDSKNEISAYLNSIKFKYELYDKNSIQVGMTVFSYGEWLEASALVNSPSLQEAGKYIAHYLHDKNPTEKKNYIIGLSNSNYMKQAFENELELIDFKKKNMKIYLDTVGLPTRY